MHADSLLGALRRSVLTAWTPAHEGPRWATWAWTALFSALIALVLR